jgi:malate dehydrogenase
VGLSLWQAILIPLSSQSTALSHLTQAPRCSVGPNQPINLHLLDIEPAMKTLSGVVMEIDDCAFPLVQKVVATADPEIAFQDCDYALLVGAFPRKAGMERKDLLKANCGIFAAHGSAMDKVAKKTVKIVVVGNPANTNAFLVSHFAPSIPRGNITALTRLDHNRCLAQVAQKAGVHVQDVHSVTIWGNHSSTQFPDASAGMIGEQKVTDVIADAEWLQNTLVSTVQKRGGAVIAARGNSSAMSAANAICGHMRDWVLGTAPGVSVSMGVVSAGQYGVTEGLVYSYPVTCSGGEWKIVEDRQIDGVTQQALKATETELLEEKGEALELVSNL